MIKPTPIDRFLRGEAPAAKKLLVLRGYRAFEEREANWMADTCLKGMWSQRSDLDVSDMPVSAFRVLGGVSNDPDDEAFSPQDQLPLFLDPLAEADIVLLATHESAGFPDASIIRLTERLYRAMHAKDPPDAVKRAFTKVKTLGVLVYGGSAAYQAATALTAAWCHFGCVLPKRGVTVYDSHRGDITRAPDIGTQLMTLGRNLLSGTKDTLGAERG